MIKTNFGINHNVTEFNE